MVRPEERRNFWTSLHLGLRGLCPSCGEAKLFRAYLKQVESCSACGEPWAEVRADDGPAWLTILIVGHILAAIGLPLAMNPSLPSWALITGLCGFCLALCLLLLPRCKGAFIAMIWSLRANSS